jgi:heme oxygenase
VRLRRETRGLHCKVEEMTDLPGSGSSREAHLLSADLESLGAVPEKSAVRLPELENIGQALGCLYAVEGSSLGGRVLAPAFRAVLGDGPTAFFDSDERMHPHPWRSVMARLRRFGLTAGNADDLVLGAQETFLAFGRHFAYRARVRTVVQ